MLENNAFIKTKTIYTFTITFLKSEFLNRKLVLYFRTYSKLAISVLNECNKDDEQWASILLLKELPSWGMVTCISLADKNRHFVSHVGVQDLIKEIWYGQLESERNSPFVSLLLFDLFILKNIASLLG